MSDNSSSMIRAASAVRAPGARAQAQGAGLGLALALPVFLLARALVPAAPPGPALLCAAIFLAALAAVLRAMAAMGYMRDSFGLPNSITLVRLALLCALAIGLVREDLLAASGLAAFGIAVLALSLDGLDGWLARRGGISTAFGARFDMEVDAALACVLALILLVSGRVGIEILLLGVTRYAFVAAGLILPWLRAPLPERFGRKAVCVIQIAVLCLLLPPWLPHWAGNGIALIAAMLLVWSFWRDILFLARQR